jgi:excisionase family DNA binding protein
MTPKKQSESDPFLTPSETMKILKIGRASFYGMIAEGKIPGAVKVGNQWRINSKVFWQQMDERSA